MPTPSFDSTLPSKPPPLLFSFGHWRGDSFCSSEECLLLSWYVRLPSCRGVCVFPLVMMCCHRVCVFPLVVVFTFSHFRVLAERIHFARNWLVRYTYEPDLHCNCVALVQTRIISALVISLVTGTLYFQMPLDQSGSDNRVSLIFMSLNYIFFSGWFL